MEAMNDSDAKKSSRGDAELPRSRFAPRLGEYAEIVLTGESATAHAGRWGEVFKARISAAFGGRVIFEVGCFDADFLCRVAKKHPSVGFVGLDWKAKAIYDGAKRVMEGGLSNVLLIRGRGQSVSLIFGEGELDELWLFHPDPFDGPGELGQRLFGESFLVEAHRSMRAGGRVVLKTDHPGYFQWALALMAQAEPAEFRRIGESGTLPRAKRNELAREGELPPRSEALGRLFSVAEVSADYWDDEAVLRRTAGRCFAGEQTGFESRFAGKGLAIYYLELERRS